MAKSYITPRAVLSSEEEEFEKLIAEAGGLEAAPHFDRGEHVTGIVVRVSSDAIFVSIGGKAEGIIERSEIDGDLPQPGDAITAMVVETGGGIRLSQRLARGVRDQGLLKEAFELHLPVEGKIAARNKGGFDVEMAGLRAFLPLGQLDMDHQTDLDAWLGQVHAFRIIEYDPDARRLVVSRAALQKDERRKKGDVLWSELQPGQVRKGTVRSVADFGCFVDLGGADGLVHVSEMQWSKGAQAKDLVSPGQEVTVTVVEVDREKKRIALSMKRLESDPWHRVVSETKVGDLVTGPVSRLERFGAFVELAPGVEGLIHVSEMTFLRRVRHPSDLVKPGDQVQAAVLDIDPITRRIALSMRAVEGDPWIEAASRFTVGTMVEGTVDHVETFGVFVTVAPGITALLPASETGQPKNADLARAYHKGSPVRAKVISVDPVERRMALSVRAIGADAEAANVNDYQQRSAGRAGPGLGTFADLLKNVKL